MTIAGKRSDLYPGRFVLASDMSYGAAIDALSTAPVKEVTTITIPEGYSREQVAPLVEEVGLTGSYLDETVKSRTWTPPPTAARSRRTSRGSSSRTPSN